MFLVLDLTWTRTILWTTNKEPKRYSPTYFNPRKLIYRRDEHWTKLHLLQANFPTSPIFPYGIKPKGISLQLITNLLLLVGHDRKIMNMHTHIMWNETMHFIICRGTMMTKYVIMDSATPFLERQVYQTQRKMIRVKWFTSCLNKQVYSLQLLAAINAIYVFKMVMKVIHASWDISGFDLQQSKPLLKIHIFFLLTTPRKKMANSQNNKLQNLIIITTITVYLCVWYYHDIIAIICKDRDGNVSMIPLTRRSYLETQNDVTRHRCL